MLRPSFLSLATIRPDPTFSQIELLEFDAEFMAQAHSEAQTVGVFTSTVEHLGFLNSCFAALESPAALVKVVEKDKTFIELFGNDPGKWKEIIGNFMEVASNVEFVDTAAVLQAVEHCPEILDCLITEDSLSEVVGNYGAELAVRTVLGIVDELDASYGTFMDVTYGKLNREVADKLAKEAAAKSASTAQPEKKIGMLKKLLEKANGKGGKIAMVTAIVIAVAIVITTVLIAIVRKNKAKLASVDASNIDEDALKTCVVSSLPAIAEFNKRITFCEKAIGALNTELKNITDKTAESLKGKLKSIGIDDPTKSASDNLEAMGYKKINDDDPIGQRGWTSSNLVRAAFTNCADIVKTMEGMTSSLPEQLKNTSDVNPDVVKEIKAMVSTTMQMVQTIYNDMTNAIVTVVKKTQGKK